MAVTLNAKDNLIEPEPEISDGFREFRRSDNDIDPGLDAEFRKLPGGRLAMIALRRAIA